MDVRARAEMLVRRPVFDVFEAFIDPEITSKFWFTRGSGRLEAGKTVTWEWGMYGLSFPVNVKALEENRRILIEWPGDEDSLTEVEWVFADRGDGSTFVGIVNSGFAGDDAQRVEQAIGSTEGFTIVLAGLKAYLEQGVRLNLVADRFPDGLGG
ncbi:SRPBCC family protein [Chelativorans sp. AA-79]|uniref:SRPBCC family protein n=1 Tax=Chelativorans sp. AA-79 TaxID=3028735 RepID=UPI0023F910AF|nr:SRPBCC family protein [Chelativorans sp. AA-79]WEX09447.1 SRPBCC family protein [Chelativorans sp. AA-79]